MAKRGRKPKEKKGYFYETEEDAILDYINTDSAEEKNRIFNETIYPALTKMIESIIRRYNLHVPDETFEDNFNDTISYLLTKISHYKPVIMLYEPTKGDEYDEKFVPMDEQEFLLKNHCLTEEDPEFVKVQIFNKKECCDEMYYYKKEVKKYKAYSYCGTVVRNYLMYKCVQYSKRLEKNLAYDDVYDEISNNSSFSTEGLKKENLAEKLTTGIVNKIEDMVENGNLSEGEIKVGKCLISLFRDWEDILPYDGSKKLQKSTILYFLRENTNMTTKEVRDNMKKFKNAYGVLKKIELDS